MTFIYLSLIQLQMEMFNATSQVSYTRNMTVINVIKDCQTAQDLSKQCVDNTYAKYSEQLTVLSKEYDACNVVETTTTTTTTASTTTTTASTVAAETTTTTAPETTTTCVCVTETTEGSTTTTTTTTTPETTTTVAEEEGKDFKLQIKLNLMNFFHSKSRTLSITRLVIANSNE